MPAAPVIIAATLRKNPDGTLRTTNPLGDFNPNPTTINVDQTAFAAALGSLIGRLTGGTALSLDLRGTWLTGAERLTCTFGIRTISGVDITTHNWTLTGSVLAQSFVSGSIGSGVLEIHALDSGNHELTYGQYSWSIAAPAGGTDILAPSVPLFLTAVPNPASSNSILATFAPSTDITMSDGTAPVGVDHYNIRRAAGGVAATVAAVLSKLPAATLYNIGSFSPSPTVVQSGKQFTMTTAGTGQNGGLSEQYAFYAWQLAGPQTMTVKVNSFTSSQAFAALGIMIRDSLTQGSPYVHWYLQPSSPGNGQQAEYRLTAGGGLAHFNIATDSGGNAITGPVWLTITRAADGQTITLSYSLDGKTQVFAGTLTIPMASTLYWGLAGASLTGGTTFSGVIEEVSLNSAPLLRTTLSATVFDTYTVEAVDVSGNISGHLTGVSATPTAPSGSTPIIFNASGVHGLIAKLGGDYGSATQAMTDWTTQANNTARLNTSGVLKGFEFGINYPRLFPVTAGDWANSQGIALFKQVFAMVAALPNQPSGGYRVSVSANAVGNTFSSQQTANSAKILCPLSWYDNIAYGPVSGNNHGGVYWNATTAGQITLRFWNAACLNDIRQCWGAIYSALEASGFHLYRIDPFMELTQAAAMKNAGSSDTLIINAMAGTTGIPNGFAKDMRAACPTSIIIARTSYPVAQVNVPTLQAALVAAQWSIANYDSTNETVIADLTVGNPHGNPRAFWGDLSFRGQNAVGGAIVSTNYKALGNDFHCCSVAEELGQHTGTLPVPNAGIGCGRLPDIFNHALEMGASHIYLHMQPSYGPRCNTIGTFSGQPANYKYPSSGSTVPYTNILDYAAALDPTLYLNPNPPVAWS